MDAAVPLCLRAALHYAETFNWKLFPARMEGGKKWSWLWKDHIPGAENWGQTNDLAQLKKNFSDPRYAKKCGVGLPTGAVNALFVLDVDTAEAHDGKDGFASLDRLQRKYGLLPATLMGKSPTGSIHYFYKHPGIRLKSEDGMAGYVGIDCKADGGMVVIAPSRNAKGQYEWINDEEIANAPAWLIELVKDEARDSDSGNGFDPDDPFHKLAEEARPPPTPTEIAAMLEVIGNDELPWDEWNRIGMAIYSVMPGDDGLELFDAFSRKANKYNARRTKQKWRLFTRSPPTKIGVGTLIYLADEADPHWRDPIEDAEEEAESAAEDSDSGIYVVTLPELNAIEAEEPQWLVRDFIMKDVINGLFGDGGTGKDWLLLQLAISMACEHDWLGVNVSPGRVLYCNVEDQLKHIRWRQSKIAEHYKIDCSQYHDRMLIAPMVGKDTILAAYDGRRGIVRPTKVYDSLRKLIDSFKPELVIVGNRVNIFSINQNDDAQARQSINLLNSLIMDFGVTVIMPSHISKSGLADESGTSGSVQWSNGVRHRSVLGYAKDVNEDEPDEKKRNKRVLEVKKTNWTSTGTKLTLHWDAPGLFVGDDENVDGVTVVKKPEPSAAERDAEIDREFMQLMQKAMAMKWRLSPQMRGAHTGIAKQLSTLSSKYNSDRGRQQLWKAFERALGKGLVVVRPYGSPSDSTFQVVLPPPEDNVIRGKFDKKD